MRHFVCCFFSLSLLIFFLDNLFSDAECIFYLLSAAITIVEIMTMAMNLPLILIKVRVLCASIDDFFKDSSSSNSLNNDRRTESNLFDMSAFAMFWTPNENY